MLNPMSDPKLESENINCVTSMKRWNWRNTVKKSKPCKCDSQEWGKEQVYNAGHQRPRWRGAGRHFDQKNVQAGQAEEKWRKQEGSVDQILAMSNSPKMSNYPKVQLSTFTTDNWASPAAGSQCSPSSHQLDWVTQDTMRRTGNQRSPNNLDPRSSPSYNFFTKSIIFCVFSTVVPSPGHTDCSFFCTESPESPDGTSVLQT